MPARRPCGASCPPWPGSWRCGRPLRRACSPRSRRASPNWVSWWPDLASLAEGRRNSSGAAPGRSGRRPTRGARSDQADGVEVARGTHDAGRGAGSQQGHGQRDEDRPADADEQHGGADDEGEQADLERDQPGQAVRVVGRARQWPALGDGSQPAHHVARRREILELRNEKQGDEGRKYKSAPHGPALPSGVVAARAAHVGQCGPSYPGGWTLSGREPCTAQFGRTGRRPSGVPFAAIAGSAARPRIDDEPPVICLGVLDDDPLDDIGDVLALVDRRLQECVDLLPLDDLEWLVALVEQTSDGLSGHLVTFVLEAVDLDPISLDSIEATEVTERLVQQLA